MKVSLAAPHLLVGSEGLDRQSPRPLYRQIADTIEHMIESGALQSGSRLPSEGALTKQLSVSRITLRQAMALLVDRKLLVRHQGKGTYVESKHQQGLGRHAFHDSFLAQADDTDTELLRFKVQSAPPDVADLMKLQAGAKVTYYERLYIGADGPVSFGKVWLNANLSHIDEARAAVMSGELMLSSVGIRLRSSETSLRAVSCSPQIAETMLVEPGSPLLMLYRKSRDTDDRIREILTCYFKADVYGFSLKQVVGHENSSASISLMAGESC